MAQVVLADEINRATPKTQSALLEAMEELQVSVDGVTYQLERPFVVMATQNPSSMRVHFHCRKRNWTGSWYVSVLDTPTLPRNSRSLSVKNRHIPSKSYAP